MAEAPALRALAHRDFRVYWIGQTVSLVGLWMQQVAQNWVVVSLTGSSAVFATISFVSSIPLLLLSLPGGVIADRYERRKILILTQLGLAALAFGYAALVGSGRLTMLHVYVLAAGWGVVAAFDFPAQLALTPELVPPRDIAGAVALNQAAFHGSRFLGPALAGALMLVTTPAMAFVANGVSYFAVIVSLVMIHPRPRPPSGASGWRQLVDGLRYVAADREVRALIGFTALTTTFVFTFLIIHMTPFVRFALHGGEAALGIIMSASGVGALGGAVTLLAVPPRARGAGILAGALAVAGLLAAVAQARGVWWTALLVGGLAFCVSFAMGLTHTLIQLAVPDQLRGRVMALNGLTFTGLMPAAALGLGVLADELGLRATMGLMAGAYAATALVWLITARVWRMGAA